MGIKLSGGVGANNEMTVTADGNANVVLPTDVDQAGFSTLAAESDDGTVLTTRTIKPLEATDDYRLRTGMDSILFNHSFEGTTVARDRFIQFTSTMAIAQTTGQVTLNSGSATGSGQAASIRTYRSFPLFGSFTTYCEIWAAHPNADATNAISEWGLGYAATNVVPSDGAYFRIISGGTLQAVVMNNGSEVSSQGIDLTNVPSRDGVKVFDIAETAHYLVATHNDDTNFWINNTLVATFRTVSTFGSPMSSSAQPMFARVRNSATSSLGRQMQVRFVNVQLGEVDSVKPWAHQMAGAGGGAYQAQPGNTSGPTVSRGNGATGWPNSTTARTAGTWTATTAPALNSLGGQWLSPAISTLTSEADYPVFSYANPDGSAALPGKTLYITGVRWGKTVATAVAATNPITLQYTVAVGGTSSATTQTEGAAIVAARGTVLDLIPFKATAVIGDYVEGGFMDFSGGPLVVYPGCFLTFVVRPFGTVTLNTLVVAGSVAFSGYHE